MRYFSEKKILISHIFATFGATLPIIWFWTPGADALEFAKPWPLTVIWVGSLIIGLILDYKLNPKPDGLLTSLIFGLIIPISIFLVGIVLILHWSDRLKYTKKRFKSHLSAAVGTLFAIFIIWMMTSMPTIYANPEFWIFTGIWVTSLIVMLFLDLKIEKETDVITSFTSGIISPVGAISRIIKLKPL